MVAYKPLLDNFTKRLIAQGVVSIPIN